MDIVYLNDLRIETVIGVYDWERRIRQTVVLDLEMGWDTSAAAAGDSLEQALDYKKVAHRLMDFVGSSSFQLVETLAEEVARVVREEFGVPWLRLRLNKQGALTGVRDVGVIIERGEKA